MANRWIPLAQSASLILLGSLLLVYRWQNKLFLLIQSNYVVLATITGVCLVLLGGVQLTRCLRPAVPINTHPVSRWGILLLVVTAVIGLLISPKPLSSQTALNRGVSPTLSLTRNQPQAFRPKTDPSQRTLLDWVRTLNVYPDPVRYEGQSVNMQGFVIHPNAEPDPHRFMIARYLISCCAADAYPVGVSVEWPQAATLAADSWQEITGSMKVETVDGKPILVVAATQVKPIPTPVNPYES